MEESRRTEAAGLMGSIAGLVAKREEVLDVRPQLADNGSHEIAGLIVVTHRGRYRVRVEPLPDE
jgi:hypothetical protein